MLSQELTECLHRQLCTLPAGDDILTSIYNPLEDKAETGETLYYVKAMEKKRWQ